ncbi:MAG: hypothetical protein ACXU99_06035 [Thermodesulfobacteriota bacterium]
MRKSDIFLIYLILNIILLFVMFTHAAHKERADMESLKEKVEMVRRLELTDLCLFTEASYTRHLSQADVHTAFQDSPLSLEHFPSGSLVGPPKSLRKLNGKMD